MALFGLLKDNMLKPINPLRYRSFKKAAVMLFIGTAICACKNENTEQVKPDIEKQRVIRIAPPSFNADSAYAFVKAQVDFGPRVPGSAAHAACANYLDGKLKSYAFETTMQKGTVETYDGKKFSLKNIIASFKPDSKSRILVCAHWDTRPWADEDSNEGYADKPFDGAKDGASGVGVALEIARQIQSASTSVGVDIILFDLEDYGDPEGDETTWCLGSQYWARNLHKPNYYANFGVLLDMVGHTNAVFPKEQQSMNFAAATVNKIWKAAEESGYRAFFVFVTRGHVGADDHIYVNKAGIPCVDIIEFDSKTGGFGDYHHTRKDNMQLIDKATLKAVGQTLLEVIYNEK